MIKEPMLAASTVPDLHTEVKYPCYIQQKLDGIRCIAIDGVAYSRKMKPIPNKFIQKFFADNNLNGFDGELMVYGDFNDVQSGVMSIDGEPDFYYVVYDLWNSEDIYQRRRSLLVQEVLKLGSPRVQNISNVIVHNAEQAESELGVFIDQGYEGGILRSVDGLYKQGRSTFKEGYLLKLKKFYDDEAVIVGYEEKLTNTNTKEVDERGKAKRSSKKEGMVAAGTLGSLIVEWKGKQFNIGSGFTDSQRQDIWDNREEYLSKPVTFKYQELTKYGIPRFPTFKALRLEYF